jgi:signal transduction histidine kinase
MIRPGNISNRFLLSFISALIIVIIGYFDWRTGYELTLSIFYLIPVALLAFYKRTTIIQLIINSFLAATVWFVSDIFTGHVYSNNFIPYWEAFVRFAIYLVVSILIFNLKEEHKKLVESNNKLQQLNDEKNTFLGIAAHDLRSPINGIIGFSELLINDKNYNQEEIDRFLKYINESGTKSLNLISNLLDVSRIEAGIVNIHLQSKNYVEFVTRCIELNHYIANKKNIKILLESENDSIIANIDPVYFEEVLNNLISNAIKYSYPGSEIKIEISKGINQIITKVIDQGVGISEKDLGKLFNPFQTSGSKPTSGESSIGLGLAIVKKIVKLHNGNISLESTLNKGTAAIFSLPLPNNKV